MNKLEELKEETKEEKEKKEKLKAKQQAMEIFANIGGRTLGIDLEKPNE